MSNLISGFAATALTGAGASLGASITVATVPVAVTSTVSAGGIAGLLGFTTTVTTVVASPIVLPVAGVIAVGALIGYGFIYGANKAIKFSQAEECKKLLEEIKLGLENKFGSKASSLWEEISHIIDIEKLKAIYEALKTAITLEEVRRVYGT